MGTLPELILAEGNQLDREVALMYMYVQTAGLWQRAANTLEGNALVDKTGEIAALRSRICGIMLKRVAKTFRDQGIEGQAELMEDMALKMTVMALKFAKEKGYPWATEE